MGTNLVVSEPPTVFDTIDDVYKSAPKQYFVQDHYANDYFKVSFFFKSR